MLIVLSADPHTISTLYSLIQLSCLHLSPLQSHVGFKQSDHHQSRFPRHLNFIVLVIFLVANKKLLGALEFLRSECGGGVNRLTIVFAETQPFFQFRLCIFVCPFFVIFLLLFGFAPFFVFCHLCVSCVLSHQFGFMLLALVSLSMIFVTATFVMMTNKWKHEKKKNFFFF